MNKKFLLVDVSVLPEEFKKVAKVKELLKNEKYDDIKKAIEEAEITEEVYNKYRDFIFELANDKVGKEIALSFVLNHEAGVLSKLLIEIAEAEGNVLTISQEPPVEDKADVILKVDISKLNRHLDNLLNQLRKIKGVEKVSLESIE